MLEIVWRIIWHWVVELEREVGNRLEEECLLKFGGRFRDRGRVLGEALGDDEEIAQREFEEDLFR